LDLEHVQRLQALTDAVQPRFVSDHACFSRVAAGQGGFQHAADLLPIAFDDQSLQRLVRHVQQVQDRLRRPLLVENLSAYLRWESDRIAEPQFFNELVRRSGCALLLDVNNLLVNARNRGEAEASCLDWIESLDEGSVQEIHLAGHAQVDGLCIDDHGSSVEPATWRLFVAAQRRFPQAQGLVEWDTDVPTLDTLLAEAAKA
jgi:uncharacterized protein (UPF0276 family)